MKKNIFKVMALLSVPFILLGCGKDDKSKENDDGKVQVSVSISPLKEFTEKIGGDKVNVQCLVPDNVEPHEFELKTRDFEELTDKQIFIYNGLGMEEWLDKVKQQLNSSTVKFVDSSEGVDVKTEDGKQDPHIWLGLKEAQVQCTNIKDALVEKDPENKEYYEANYKEFIEELDEVYKEFEPKLKGLNSKSFVTSHEAFGYLCRDFGLTQKYLNDMFGEGEPTAKDYEDLTKYCTENRVDTIFSEGTESSKEAETLANEINGKIEPLYTLETKVEGSSYVEVMRDNLQKIYDALK